MRVFVLLFFTLVFFSCKRKWTDKDKNEFYSGCLSNATTNKDIADPKKYCNCLLQKVVSKYPNANDAKYMRYDTSLRQLATDCLEVR